MGHNLYLVPVVLGCVFLVIPGARGEVDFELKLNNSSPAVLYSAVYFKAQLKITKIGLEPQINSYRYVWNDSATNTSVEDFGNGTSEISEVYTPITMKIFKAGNYDMTVEVFRKINQSETTWDGNQKRITTAAMTFQLTNDLNTVVHLNQSLSTVSPEGVYATERDINIGVQVTDHFIDSVTFVYELYTNNSVEPTIISNTPTFSVLYNRPGLTNISVKTTANIFTHKSAGFLYIPSRQQMENKTILLKEQVHHIEYLGPTQYTEGQNITAMFVCYGSPPFLFSWGIAANIQPVVNDLKSSSWTPPLPSPANLSNVTNSSSSQPLLIETFSQSTWKVDTVKRNQCFAEYRNVFNVTGNFTLYLRVENDVGYNQTHVIFSVVQPADRIEPVIIVICVVVALIAFVAILIAYLKERHTLSVQTPNEETANHYFYFNRRDGNLLQEYKGPYNSREGIYVHSDSSRGSPDSQTSPKRVKDGLSVMYNTARNWVTGISSSWTSQNSACSYENL